MRCAYADGFRHFICGMALGCDFYFAEAVLALKLAHSDVTLEAAIPCPTQADGWTAAERSRYHALLERCEVKAISHITGGGFFENIPRMLKNGLTAKIDTASIPKLPIFDLMQKTGAIPTREMYNTFNMGVGMCIAVAKDRVDTALAALKEAGTDAFVMGEVVPGEEGVVLC